MRPQTQRTGGRMPSGIWRWDMAPRHSSRPGRPLLGPGQRQPACPRPGRPEGGHGLGNRGACGQHVVDHHDPAGPHPGRPRDRERPAHVVPALPGTEARLGRSRAPADEEPGNVRRTDPVRDGGCEHCGLVVTALAEPRGMEWHRGDEDAAPGTVRLHEERDPVVVHERRMHAVARVTEAGVRWPLVPQAMSAERMREAREPRDAGRAEQRLRGRGRAAARAALRQREVEKVGGERAPRPLDVASRSENADRDRTECLGGGPPRQRGQPTAAPSGASGTSRPNQCASECRAWWTRRPRPSTAAKPWARAPAIHGVSAAP